MTISISRAESLEGYKKCNANDLVINIMLAWKRGLGVSDFNGIVSPAYCVFRPINENFINPKYFHYLLRTDLYTGFFKSRSTGVIDSRLRLYPDVFGSIEIIFPPKPEQDNIVCFLDREIAKIDDLIIQQQQLIELLKEKRQAIISHAVTRGLNQYAPMKESGVEWLGVVPEHWALSILGFESWVRARLGWKGLKAEEYVDNGFIFLATPNIKGIDIDFENVNYINEQRYEESPEIKLREGDVLLAKDGSTLGIVNVIRRLDRPSTVNSSIAVITPHQNLHGIFLYYLFQSSFMKNIIEITKGGMGVPHLFQEDINKFRIPMPPFHEQVSIATHLDRQTAKIDALTDAACNAITLLQERRTTLISSAVTGKIDVRGITQQEVS